MRMLVSLGTSIVFGSFIELGSRTDESGMPIAEWIEVTHEEWPFHADEEPTIIYCPECEYEDGSFGCKIRHIQFNSGEAKAAND